MQRLLWSALFASVGAIAAPLDMDQFRAWDYDRDGFVDATEAQSSVDLSGRFNDIDVDRDGRIGEAEMQAWIDKPDKLNQLRDSAPIRAHEQWRATEARRLEQESQRAQRILSGEDPAAEPAPTGAPPM